VIREPKVYDVEPPVPRRRSTVLDTFRFRDFRLLWGGLLISNLGTWMQFTTLGYVVVTLAGTPRLAALDVGILGACNAVPALIFSPLAGVVADRYPRRRTLLLTNTAISCVALALALLATAGKLRLWEIFILSSCRAAVQSFDSPARQSWVPLLVPRQFVGNAIGLNSLAFNAPSVVGPPVAGFLIIATGIAASFYVNAVATLAVVAALLLMRPAPPSAARPERVLALIAGGLRFLWGHAALRSILIVLIASCLLVRPYSQLLPAYAVHVLHADARGLGVLFAAVGFGAICGSVVTALLGAHRRAGVWFGSAAVMSLGTIALSFVHVYALAICVLVAVGLAVMSFAGSSNVLIQTLSPDEMRGRAISVFTMVILGLVPLGSLLLGTLATFVGLQAALAAGGAVSFLLSVVVFAGNAELRRV
jgi:MFS family permease